MGQLSSSAEASQIIECTGQEARLMQLFQSLREVPHEGIDDERWQQTIDAVMAGARAQLAMLLDGRADPTGFRQLAACIEYLGMMQNDWASRCALPTVQLYMEELGRAASKIGHGLFPLNDPSDPAYCPRKKQD